MEADTYSKSVLRAAVEEFQLLYDNVYYFPSFELVKSSNKEVAFMEDNRHVRDEFVQYIVSIFLLKCSDLKAGKIEAALPSLSEEVIRETYQKFREKYLI